MSPKYGYLIQQTSEFKEQILKAIRKNGDLKEPVAKKMREISANPLMGDPKTGALKGFRRIHVHDHWTLTWKLDPVIVSPDLLENLKSVTWVKFGKHE